MALRQDRQEQGATAADAADAAAVAAQAEIGDGLLAGGPDGEIDGEKGGGCARQRCAWRPAAPRKQRGGSWGAWPGTEKGFRRVVAFLALAATRVFVRRRWGRSGAAAFAWAGAEAADAGRSLPPARAALAFAPAALSVESDLLLVDWGNGFSGIDRDESKHHFRERWPGVRQIMTT